MWLVGVTGCRIHFDELPIDAADTVDTLDRCATEQEVLGPWSAPTRLTQLGSNAADEDPALRADLLELIFISARTGNSELWRSTRATPGDPWGTPTQIVELADPGGEATPDLSPDGLTLWFSSDRAGGLGMDDIWVTTRPTLTSMWTTPVPESVLNSPALDRGATVFDNGLSFAFHSNRAGGLGANDIYLATRAAQTDAWSAPVSIGSPPNSAGTEQHPWLSVCGLWLVFHRYPAAATADLYETSRASPSDPFATAQPIAELNVMNEDDKDLRMSPSRRYGVFSSTRTGGVGLELYETTR